MTDDGSLLVRLDERTREIKEQLKTLNKKFDEYVTQHEFSPVQKIVYGLAGLVLTAFVSALIALVVTR